MDTFEKKLDKYAELVVKVGVNVQAGQTIVINAYLHDAPFVRLLTKKAYETGAKHVYVNWSDEEIAKLKYELAPDEAFEEFPYWRAKEREELAEQGAAFISIASSNPDLLKGVDPKRIATFNKAAGQAMHKYRQYIQSDKVSWTIIGASSKSWATKVFPNISDSEKVEKLWDAIFKACRIDHEDPVQAWREHDQFLHNIVEYLNGKRYEKLHYTAPGTDLIIRLPKNHLWVGGGSVNEKGHAFMANMPTEEVFTAPDKYGVDGYVTSTKPLSYGGNLIENFTLTFEKGRIIDVKAEKGEEILRNLIESDEGSHYLGEVALVPHQSPISQSNILFYNTLFDENASNHLAIGSGYAFCIEGGKSMTEEELLKHGVNRSITHVDFMIGSEKMNIDGILSDGQKEPIFRNGNWAFDLSK
ncbi:aminopeptidase [Fervidibacillus halotolerans]|uniref:Aminopeptidase n=1 Tax=Fervidibacillus halotolerans TaxID=2980027 RepID=A0A9E8S0P3_9BACI|nr:aminopeptidase [Fervidibacillus halotolerans]WAA12767.1 aminopeptidase [Fervidibacillus halotolerans]